VPSAEFAEDVLRQPFGFQIGFFDYDAAFDRAEVFAEGEAFEGGWENPRPSRRAWLRIGFGET